MSATVEQVLCVRLTALTLHLSDALEVIDWTDADELALADRSMRILSSYGRNIEKCLTMNNSHTHEEHAVVDPAEIERLQKDIQRRLREYAERVGPEELDRRVRARGFDPDRVRMELLGTDKPDPAERG